MVGIGVALTLILVEVPNERASVGLPHLTDDNRCLTSVIMLSEWSSAELFSWKYSHNHLYEHGPNHGFDMCNVLLDVGMSHVETGSYAIVAV